MAAVKSVLAAMAQFPSDDKLQEHALGLFVNLSFCDANIPALQANATLLSLVSAAADTHSTCNRLMDFVAHLTFRLL